MFDIPDIKTFKDSVHGYIIVPKCFVSNIIDTAEFQRLRNIDQTGMKVLYPNAKHDRFSHSLGVFHLGSKAVDALLDNFVRDDYWDIWSNNRSVLFWAKNKVLFLIACLLHDIGHAPFSHSLEELVLNNVRGNEKPTDRLIRMINEFEDDKVETIAIGNGEKIDAAAHEIIGSLFILERFWDKIDKLFDNLIAMQYPNISSPSILSSENYSYNPIIDKDGFESDMCFIVRMIMGLKYRGFTPEKQIRNCFIELLNGKNVDVDKLDYIIRDTKMSGISNISIDVERLLGAVCIITKTKYVDSIALKGIRNGLVSELLGDEKSIIEIDGEFRGSFLLFHDCTVSMKEDSEFVLLTTNEVGEVSFPSNVVAYFSEETKIIQNGVLRVPVGGLVSTEDKNHAPHKCTIRDAVVKRAPNSLPGSGSFVFQVKTDTNHPVELQINGRCALSIQGKFKSKSPISCFGKTSIDGNIQTATIIGNTIKAKVPNEKAFNGFSVGFSKQAINSISNVLEARDYLYLWVYAHHKVIYYANFLIPSLSKVLLLSSEKNRKYLSWQLNYEHIEFVDDCYVWTVFKSFLNNPKPWKKIEARRKDEVEKLCKELFGRKYKISLFKSLAEYDILFEPFSDEEKLLAKSKLMESIRNDLPTVGLSQVTAGYLKDNVLKQITKKARLRNITSIVVADASYSQKTIDVNNSFVRLNNDVVFAISEIPLLSNRVVDTVQTKHYFYVYFATKTVELDKIKLESEELKRSLRDYLKVRVRKTNTIK